MAAEAAGWHCSPERRNGQLTGKHIARAPLGNGKFRRVTCATPKEARETLRRLLEDQEARIDLRAASMSLSVWLDSWLLHLQNTKAVVERTWEFYQRHSGYGAAYLGHLAMEKLEPRHWRETQAHLLRDGLSPRSVNHVQTVLGTALNMAVRERVIRENPLRSTLVEKLPLGEHEFEARVLDDHEIDALVAACATERIGLMILFILDHGVRNGEARALRWADVHLDAVDREGRPAPFVEIRESKTKAGRRRLPLTDSWVGWLRAQWARVAEERDTAGKRGRWQEHGYVFPSEVGTRLLEQNVNKIKQRILIAAGLCDPCLACNETGRLSGKDGKPVRCEACLGRGALVWPVRIHDLRHTYVTDLIALGVDPKTVQGIIGHEDPGMTMRVYAKYRDGQARDAVERVAAKRKRGSG